MIYYFSGTGNSAHIAKRASSIIQDALSSITAPSPIEGDAIGLIFPVYAWGIPKVLDDFILRTLPSLISSHSVKYVYAIMTHGDDMGYADRILRNRLASIGFPLHASFSLSMPNTYVCLPGFDVDAPELAQSKIDGSAHMLTSICQQILDRAEVTQVTRGALPLTKTYVLRPLFNRFLVTDRYFRTTTSQCTLCGKCAKQCPLANIAIVKNSVTWQGNCTGCLRCYHQCPNNAIQFGKYTEGKGQKTILL